MTSDRLDLAPELESRLARLDTLVDGELREHIDRAIAASREMLRTTDEPYGWGFLDLSVAAVPDEIRSGSIFVLPGGTAPPGHRHPNSVQHMRVLSGEARVTIGSASEDSERHDIGPARRWLVIPQNAFHSFELPGHQDLVVLSFHTVPQAELLEVSDAGRRTYS